jgi:hypothetical protein
LPSDRFPSVGKGPPNTLFGRKESSLVYADAQICGLEPFIFCSQVMPGQLLNAPVAQLSSPKIVQFIPAGHKKVTIDKQNDRLSRFESSFLSEGNNS